VSLRKYITQLPARSELPIASRGVQLNEVDPVKVCPRAPGISHLLFADDPILFFRSQQDQAERMLNIINTYATAMGQLINYDKC
jgi:hypothetical protein